jgi:hypothetical protein
MLLQFLIGIIMLFLYFIQHNGFYLVCAILIIGSTFIDVYNKIIDRTSKPDIRSSDQSNVALKKLNYNRRTLIEGLLMCLIGFLVFEIWVNASGYKSLFVILAVLIAGRLLLTNVQLNRLKEKDKKND